MMRIIRVFPRLTNCTPQDDFAFIGNPPLMRPEADEVHISVAFTWDIEEGERLQKAWSLYYPNVKIGGPALLDPCNGDFSPGQYIKQGYLFTSRGCNNNCPWCLVPWSEGKLRLLPIVNGYIIGDNNLLQTGKKHMAEVFSMLKRQRKWAIFAGGLQASLVDDWVVEQLRGQRIAMLFLAADTEGALILLRKAVSKLSFLSRGQLRCYMLLAYRGESIDTARGRLEEAWDIGVMPFALLYQPPDQYIVYSAAWRALARSWARPAIMKAMHRDSR